MGLLELIFGKKIDYADLKSRGAVVIDVRSAGEYKGGHVSGSKNIPLDQISKRVKELQKLNKPVIFCCASGTRSGMANRIAKREGVESYNGGSWGKVNYNYK